MNSETDQIARLFQELGATEQQAQVMAAQLLKRAEQLAEERNVSRVEAMEYLLKVAVAGHQGQVYDGPPPGERHNKAD
jgi:hypothetical protein